MTTGYLANKMTATPSLQRVVGASSATLGNPLQSAAALAYTAGNGTVTCTSVRAFGALFRASPFGVWRSTDDGTSWVLVFGFAATATWVIGIFVVYDGAGVPTLAVLYNGAANLIFGAVSATGLSGSWTSTAAASSTISTSGFPIVFHSTIVFRLTGVGANVVTYNPASATFGVVASTGTPDNQSQYMVAWNDVLYMVANVASVLALVSLAGGGFASVATIVAATNAFLAVSAWVDPATNDLVVVGYNGTAGVWKAFSVTAAPTFTVTDRTANMLTGGTLVTFASTSKVAGVLYDQDSNPGGDPAIYLLVASTNTAGTPVSLFKFNGFGAGAGANLLGVLATGAPNDSGGAIEFCWPDKNIGGERFFTPRSAGTPGTPEVWNTGKGALGTAITRRKFKLIAPRSQILTTLGGAGTYNLAGTPLATTPIQSGGTTITGVIGGIVHAASDIVAPGVLAAPATTTTAVQALPAATINVVSTFAAAFPTAGTIIVDTGTPQTVAYTGLGAAGTTFTGCTGGTGSTSIGGFVRGGLLPIPGTIDNATGAMTGTTGTLDAASQVVGMSNAGTASDQWYRSAGSDNYPGSTAAATLTLPTSGVIDGFGTTNTGCTADATEQQVSVDMTGFTSGERVNIDPRALS